MDEETLQKYKQEVGDYKPPEPLEKYWPTGLCGFDREGHAIKWDALGRIDYQGLLKSVDIEDIIKFKCQSGIHVIEACKKHAEETGNPPALGQTTIFDLEGTSMQHVYRPGLKMMSQISNMFDEKYPGMIKRMIVIKAPRIFPILYNLMTPIVSKEMKEKIIVTSGSAWMEDLQKYISPDQLPEYYGGTMKDVNGDPMCSAKICYGGKVPDQYYRSNLIKDLDKDDFDTVNVSAGTKYKIPIQVTSSRFLISWKFVTDGHDIAYKLYKTTSSSKKSSTQKDYLLPMKRVQSNLEIEEGQLQVQIPGEYYFVFDNTYSWVHSKNVYFKVNGKDEELQEEKSYENGVVESDDKSIHEMEMGVEKLTITPTERCN